MCISYQSVSGLRSCGLWLEHHPRKVLVTAVLVGAQRCANLLAVEDAFVPVLKLSLGGVAVDLLLARAPSERRDPQLVRLARLVSDVRPAESGPGQSRPAEG